MNPILDAFATMNVWQAAFWSLVENLALFSLALGVGEVLVWSFQDRRIEPEPPPLEWQELFLALACVVGNAVVTLVGWWLWRKGFLVIRRDTGLRAWLDVLVLFFLMDLAMYVTHRLAHLAWVYPIVHQTHHQYDRPRPLDLFVLNPLEVLGFGSLWLVVMYAYPSSWLGIVVYLALNLMFGMMGHLGVEPLPESWSRRPILRSLGTSTFHAGHHHDREGNYGFYTLIWDRLFGTLHKNDQVKTF